MHAGESRDGGRSVFRGSWGLGLIGIAWLALVAAGASQAQTSPILPDPLPPPAEANEPTAPPADPFAGPETEQEPGHPSQPNAEPRSNQAQGQDLTARYLLTESYTEAVDGDQRADDGRLSEYQVAFRETVTEMNDNPQGSPDKQVVTRQARFTERPVEVGPGDDRMVSALLRRYEGARVDPDPWAKTSRIPLMDDLTIWYESLPGAPARILTTTPGRSLLEQECQFARGNPLVSDFAYILPEFPVQILDDWPVDRRGISALLSTPVAQAEVVAKLIDVRPTDEAKAGEQVAVIDLAGRATTQQGMTQLNAQVEFTFQPSPIDQAIEPTDGSIEGRGGITKVRLAQATTTPRQGADGPLGGTTRRSLVLHRRWPSDGPPLQGPKAAPEATPENSWLTFEDLEGRFSIRYPQEYTHDYRFGVQNVVALMKASGPAAGQPDSIFLAFFEDQQPRADTVFPSFFDKHRQGGFQVRSTEPTQLPEDQWPGVEVQRVEAALTPDPRLTTTNPAGAQLPRRLHFDGYLLRFTRNAALTAEAITAQDASAAFRDEVEAVLKTFQLGTSSSEPSKP